MRVWIPLALAIALLPTSARAQAGKEAQERAAKKACLVGDTTRGVEILADLFIDTNDPNYIFNQGRCYEQNRLYEEAIARFREYLVKAKNATSEAQADADKHIAACQAYLAEAKAQQATGAPGPPPEPTFPPPTDVPAAGLAAGSALPEVPPPPPPAPHNRRKPLAIWLAMGGGTGAAYHGRQAVDSRSRSTATGVAVPVAAGFSRASLLQLEPELGLQVSEHFAFAVLLRYQFAPKADTDWVPSTGENAIPTSALAGFLRAEVSFFNLGNFRSYLTAGAGLGTSFLAVVGKDCDLTACPLSHSDTLQGGMLGVLGGLGAAYHLTSNFGVFFDVKEIVTFRTILALTEFNLGMAVSVDLL